MTSAKGTDPATGDIGLRRTSHKTLGEITELLESHRFNVVVARLMELVNATRKAIDKGCGPADPAVREAAEFTSVALSVLAPYVAEEMWEVLGHAPSIANASWPVVDESLRTEQQTTMVVQVQGKVRAKIDVPTDITEDDAKAAALADPNVQRALDGREVAQVIVRLPKMVSIVPR